MAHGILFDSKTNQKQSVEVLFSVNNVELFIPGSSPKVLSPQHVTFETGGNNDSLLFFKSTEVPEHSIYFEVSRSLFAEISQCHALRKKIEFAQKESRQRFRQGSYLIFGLLAFLILIVVYRGPIFGSLGAAVPFAVEKSLADQIFTSRFTQEQIDTEKKLAKLVDKILINEPNWKDRLTFHISSSTELNAYATIGGHIFVNKALIQNLKTQEQLLGVLAHEFQHIKKRHVSRSIAQAIGLFGVFQILLGDVTGIAAVVLDQGGALANLQYSRELEEEADQEALNLLSAAQLRSHGLGEALAIIFDHQKKIISESPMGKVAEKLQKIEILGSHPETEKRIASLKERAASTDQFSQLDPEEFESLKKEVMEKF